MDVLDEFRHELSVKAKNGIDFIISAGIIWLLISFIWMLQLNSYSKSILTFIAGGPMLPLAFLLSKALKTTWSLKSNPLQPLGLWLNVAQLLYFPFLIFALIKTPDYFVMVYAIITGAHLFPYAWFYRTNWYAIMAGLMSFGSLILGLTVPPEYFYAIPLFMVFSLTLLALLNYISYTKRKDSVNK